MSNHSNVAAAWDTCGGLTFTGPTKYVEGYVCIVIDQWYSQCYSAPPLGGKTWITCGSPNTDVAGIGVLVVFTSQTVLSLGLVLWACMIQDEKMQRYIIRVLLCVTDVQALNGIGLTISAIINHRSEDIYHLRLIYDNISLAGISIWPASTFLRSLDDFESRQAVRQLSSLLFTIFYFTFAILLILRLTTWNDSIPGQCYESGFLHSLSAIPYVAVSGLVLITAILVSARAYPTAWLGTPLIWLATVQAIFPLVSLGSLRRAPQNFLVRGFSDNEFGYGQIMAMVLLLAIPFEAYRCFRDYRTSTGQLRFQEVVRLNSVRRLKSLRRPFAEQRETPVGAETTCDSSAEWPPKQ